MITKGAKDDLLSIVRKLIPDVRDVLVFGGIAAAAYGISTLPWIAAGPAAWIFAGLALAWLGIR